MQQPETRNWLKFKLESYDHRVLDHEIIKIIDLVNSAGVAMYGPIPLPVKKKIYTVLRSVHKHKDAREQFEKRVHARLIGINQFQNPELIRNLKELELSPMIHITVKTVKQPKKPT